MLIDLSLVKEPRIGNAHQLAGANIALDLIPMAPSRAIQMAGNLVPECL